MSLTTSLVSAQLTLPTLKTTKQHTSVPVPTRRQLLLSVSSAAALVVAPALRAEDIGLFGIRKSLRKIEQEAEEIVREGFEAADKGIVAAEKGIKAAEKGIEAAEKGVVEAEKEVVSFGGLAQAGAVAGAEVVGILVATSVVNGILGPEA